MIEAELAAFLEEGLGIYVGTRNGRLEPHGARGAAVCVEPGGTHAVVFVAEVAAARLRADLDANGQIAVSIGRPRDDRACQIKGVVTGIEPAGEPARPLVLSQWERFRDALEYIGISREATSGWVAWPAVAIRFKVTAVFEQTPGPAAGTAIR